MGSGAAQRHDASKDFIGTLPYMAPERVGGKGDIRADLYSLGLTLYELLTFRPAFDETNLDKLVEQRKNDPPRPRKLNAAVPRDLETIVLKAIKKDPNRRYQSPAALVDDLRSFIQDRPIRARPVGFIERIVKWMRRHPAAAALCIVLALTGIGLVYGGWLHYDRLQAAFLVAEAQRQEAEKQRLLAQANAEEARRQSAMVAANYQKRLEDLEDHLIWVDGRLADFPGMEDLRGELIQMHIQRCEQLLTECPNDARALRTTSLSHCRLAEVLTQSGAPKEAEEAYQKAQKVQEQLAGNFLEQLDYQNDLAQICAKLAKLLQDQRRFTEAQANFGKAIEIEDRLATRAPKNAAYAELAAWYRFNLGNLFEGTGEPGKAEPLYRDALERLEKLVDLFPDLASGHHHLATTAHSLAVLLSGSHPAEAERMMSRMLDARCRAKELAPEDESYQEKLRQGYVEARRFFKKRGKHVELSRLATRLSDDFRDSQPDKFDAARLFANAATVVQVDRQLSAAQRQRLFDDYGKRAAEKMTESFKQGNLDPDHNVDPAHLDKDQDFDPLRGRADYQALREELLKRSSDQEAPTPERELVDLVRDYDKNHYRYVKAVRTAESVAERKRAEEAKPRVDETARLLLELATKNPESLVAVEALVWILAHSAPSNESKPAETITSLRKQAVGILEEEYSHKPAFVRLCHFLADKPMPDLDKLLMRAAGQKHAPAEVRAWAGYALALSFAAQAESARSQGLSKEAELEGRAKQQLEQILQKYADVPTEKGTLGQAANDILDELRCLSKGRVAPEIVGKDFEGRMLKLSHYRGKVVVLYFWANSCIYCRQMYPHLRKLMQRLKGQPFALLGVNRDNVKADVPGVIKKQRLEWPSWKDGNGSIAKQYQVEVSPVIYVLDPNGVIRYKFDEAVRDELDEAVNHLLKE
jgi:peroxiredoxin/tetratricopeptide (TPR) repeat protein